MKPTKKQKLPAGWTEERVRKLAEHYDNQSEADQVAGRHSRRVFENWTNSLPLSSRGLKKEIGQGRSSPARLHF